MRERRLGSGKDCLPDPLFSFFYGCYETLPSFVARYMVAVADNFRRRFIGGQFHTFLVFLGVSDRFVHVLLLRVDAL